MDRSIVKHLLRVVGPLFAMLLFAGALPASAQPVEDIALKRCLLRVIGDAVPPLPTPAAPTERHEIDGLINANSVMSEKFAVHKEPSLNAAGAYDLYAAYDSTTHRLLAIQKYFSWTYLSFYEAPRRACPLPEAQLDQIRTKSGFTLGSSERDVVARLGEGDPIRGDGVTARYYKGECDSIKFVFRNGRVVEIDGDPGAWC